MENGYLVYSFYTVTEAAIFAGMLKNNGIIYNMVDSLINSIYPMSNLANGGVKIYVMPQDAEQAQQLLDEYLNPPNREEVTESYHPIMCINCGSFNVLHIPVEKMQYFEEYRCFDCDFEWDNKNEKNINPGIWE